VTELEFGEAAARLRPGTPDNAPLIGERDGLIWATGHHRNGVLLAPITAVAVAAMVAGESPPDVVESFAPGRFVAA
jgi:glycine oxidase